MPKRHNANIIARRRGNVKIQTQKETVLQDIVGKRGADGNAAGDKRRPTMCKGLPPSCRGDSQIARLALVRDTLLQRKRAALRLFFGLRRRHSPYLLGFEKLQLHRGRGLRIRMQIARKSAAAVFPYGKAGCRAKKKSRAAALFRSAPKAQPVAILRGRRCVSADHSADPPPCRPSRSGPFPARRHGRRWKAPSLRSARRAERLRRPWKLP